MDIDSGSGRVTGLVAVYPDRGTVLQVRRRLEACGVGPGRIRIGEDATSLEAEMRSEQDRAVGGAGIGVFMTGGQASGAFTLALLVGAAGAVIGALAGIPALGVFGPWYWRALWGAVIGAAVFGTVGLVIGGGFAAEHADEAPAAQTGVSLAVHAVDASVVEVLRDAEPTRLDELRDGEVVRTIVERRPGVLRRLGRGLADPASRQ
jgi:hypothetical protein